MTRKVVTLESVDAAETEGQGNAGHPPDRWARVGTVIEVLGAAFGPLASVCYVAPRMLGSPFGTHRVLEPPGALPQPAWRLDNDSSRRFDSEIHLAVET